jgi:hypothetical protein
VALLRLHSVRELGIKLPEAAHIPATRVAALARFAGVAKASAILRLPNSRRLATLVAFVHCLEATAQDDALEVLEAVLRELFGGAVKADKKARLRSLKDLDKAAATLASACQMVLDGTLPDAELRTKLFEKIPRDTLTKALDGVNALIRPADNVFYQELDAKYKTVRRFLPTLVEHVRFGANTAGGPVVAAFDWLRAHMVCKKPGDDAPRDVIGKSWRRYVLREDGTVDFHAYIVSVRAWPTSAGLASGGLTSRPTTACSIRSRHTISVCTRSSRTGMTCCAWWGRSSLAECRRRASCVRFRSATGRPGWHKPSPSSAGSKRPCTR